MLVSFLPPPSWGGIVVYVNHRALSSILGLKLRRKTEREGSDAELHRCAIQHQHCVGESLKMLSVWGLVLLLQYDLILVTIMGLGTNLRPNYQKAPYICSQVLKILWNNLIWSSFIIWYLITWIWKPASCLLFRCWTYLHFNGDPWLLSYCVIINRLPLSLAQSEFSCLVQGCYKIHLNIILGSIAFVIVSSFDICFTCSITLRTGDILASFLHPHAVLDIKI